MSFSLNTKTVHDQWRYSLDHEFQAILPDGQLGEEATWAPGSPHDSTSNALKRFIAFPKRVDEWNHWSINCDQTVLAVSSSRGFENNAGVLLVDLSTDEVTVTASGEGEAQPPPEPAGYLGRLGQYVFGTKSRPADESNESDSTRSPTRSIQGFAGRLSSLVFSPTDPNLLIVATEPSPMRGGSDSTEKETIVFVNISDEPQSGRRPVPEPVLTNVASKTVGHLKAELKQNQASKKLVISEEDGNGIEKNLVDALRRIELASAFHHRPKLFGRLATNFGSVPVSHDGKKLLYLPGARPDSNGHDDRWEIGIYDLNAKKTTATLHGHEDAIMWTGFSPSGKWILTVAWDKTVRLWTSEGREKWVWKTKGQNWTGSFSPDETYVIGTCGDSSIHAWDIETGEELWKHKSDQRRWVRQISISPDGKYLAFGGEEGGKVSILDLEVPVGENKFRGVLTYRELGAEGVKLPKDEDDDDDDDVPSKHRQTPEQRAKAWRAFVKHIITTRDVQFINLQGGSSPTRHLVGYMNNVDRGLEIYDVDGNVKWRAQSVTDERSPRVDKGREDVEDTQLVDDGKAENLETTNGPRKTDGNAIPKILDGLLGWTHLVARNEVMTVHSDGVRFWSFEL